MPDNAAGRSVTLEMDENSRIRDVVDRLKLPQKTIKLIFVNGVHAKLDTILTDGDRVGLFPPVGGG